MLCVCVCVFLFLIFVACIDNQVCHVKPTGPVAGGTHTAAAEGVGVHTVVPGLAHGKSSTGLPNWSQKLGKC